jgi:NAD(P)-dependent dehydrogenase (short-subunit alcohol dehydrogenase family)
VTLAPSGDVVLVTSDGLGTAERLAHALRQGGRRPVVIGAPDLDLADGEQVTDAVERVRATHGPVRGVVHLAALAGGPDPARVDLDGWRTGLRRQVTSLFHLARALQADVLDGPGSWLLAVTGLGGDPATATEAGGAGVAGLTRSLAEEAACRVRLVHLPAGARDAEQDAVILGREIERVHTATDREVGYAGGRRLRPRVAAAPLPQRTGPVARPGDVFLLTGGARGITAHAAHALAGPATTFVLVGRSSGPLRPEDAATAGVPDEPALRALLVDAARRGGAPIDLAAVATRARTLVADREARANLASLRAAGGAVDYRAADLRDETQVARLLADVHDEHGRIDGVIHGAGVLEDRLLRDKSPASFEHVLHTKTDSAYLLAHHLDPQRLRFLVLFGSVAGRFGNAGQTDYAAANEVLAALSRRLDATWPGRVVTMCWGPWSGSGMVTPEVERRFRERGVEPIAPELGRRLLLEELERGPAGEPVVVFGRGPWAVGSTRPSAMPLERVEGAPGQLELVLDPASDGYLDDHRLDGVPVLPAAVAAELLAEVAELELPGHRLVELHDLATLHGVVLDDGPMRLRVAVGAREPGPGGTVRCAVTLGPAGAPRASYRATAVLAPDGPRTPQAPVRPPYPSDAGVHDTPPTPPAPGAAYAGLLFHGPTLQGLDSIVADGTGWTAAVHHVPPERFTTRWGGGPWVLDPSLLDLGPQLAILWSRETHGTTTLPMRFGAVRRGWATGDPARLTLRFRVRPGAHATWQVADFEVLNADGSERLAVTGLEGAGTSSLNRLATTGAAR